jgi:hypothetical protein
MINPGALTDICVIFEINILSMDRLMDIHHIVIFRKPGHLYIQILGIDAHISRFK